MDEVLAAVTVMGQLRVGLASEHALGVDSDLGNRDWIVQQSADQWGVEGVQRVAEERGMSNGI